MSALPVENPAPEDDHDYDTPLPYGQEWVLDDVIEIPDDEGEG